MAQWQRTIRLNPMWQQCKVGAVTRQQMAGVIGAALRKIKPFGDPDIDEARDDLAADFESMSRDETLTVEDFDGQMGALYDWGDQSLDSKWNGKKVCWIDTISGRTSSVPSTTRHSPEDSSHG